MEDNKINIEYNGDTPNGKNMVIPNQEPKMETTTRTTVNNDITIDRNLTVRDIVKYLKPNQTITLKDDTEFMTYFSNSSETYVKAYDIHRDFTDERLLSMTVLEMYTSDNQLILLVK